MKRMACLALCLVLAFGILSPAAAGDATVTPTPPSWVRKRLQENFTSWDQAYENYLDGYNWWARNDVLGKDIWQTERGRLYLEMKDDPVLGKLFDNGLFDQEIIGVPNVTAEQIAESAAAQ